MKTVATISKPSSRVLRREPVAVRGLSRISTRALLAKGMKKREGRGVALLSLLPLEPRENLSDGGAAGACTRAGSIHADHAGLIGVVHILSGGGRSDRLGCYRIKLIGRTRGERKRVAALLAG